MLESFIPQKIYQPIEARPLSLITPFEPDLKVPLPRGEGFRVRASDMLFICLSLKLTKADGFVRINGLFIFC
jgi:hypothetical protein